MTPENRLERLQLSYRHSQSKVKSVLSKPCAGVTPFSVTVPTKIFSLTKQSPNHRLLADSLPCLCFSERTMRMGTSMEPRRGTRAPIGTNRQCPGNFLVWNEPLGISETYVSEIAAMPSAPARARP